ncbi:MAG: aminopeptidase [Candidatus Omnitrophica bacterium]|nr:aminopeptidase [Candidatus Omnitrophota bacterium]
MINDNAVKAVFERSLKLKNNESCLIVTDTIKEPIGRALYEYASKITSKAKIVVIEPTREHATEPPREVAELMLEYDVEILVTEKSLTHTQARRKASSKGVRIATMPSITEEIANRCLDIDYDDLKKASNRLHDKLKDAKQVRVTTALGTDIVFEIHRGEFFGKNGGSYDTPGSYGNLPEGEVAFAPKSAEGIVIIDASMAGLGLLSSPLTVKIENCFAVSITGERSKELIAKLDAVGEKAYMIAELGIGLNPKATIIGKILEDEKVIGTVHVAFGNNCSFGGTNDIPLHLDGVIKDAQIYVDGKKITI